MEWTDEMRATRKELWAKVTVVEEAMFDIYRCLPNENRSFIMKRVLYIEGSWGDLAYEEEREQEGIVFVNAVPTEPLFGHLFKNWLDLRYEAAKWEAQADPIRIEGRDYSRMAAAEHAFRDFHWSFERAEEEVR